MTLRGVRTKLVATAAVAFVLAGGAVTWVLGASLKPTEATAAAHKMEIDISDLPVGAVRRIEWEAFDVFVLHRTAAQVSWLDSYSPPVLGSHCIDDIPSSDFRNRYRSLSPEFLVVAIWRDGSIWRINENRSLLYQCADFRYTAEPIRVSERTTFPGGFYCASMPSVDRGDFVGSSFVYDPAGRSASRWYQPLTVPPHHVEGDLLVLDLSDR
jgi:hypothetical protein